MKFFLKDIIEATEGRLIAGSDAIELAGVGIDTRKTLEGRLFAAIQGAHFDGHDFLGDAQKAGAHALLVRHGSRLPQGIAAVEVKDTERALGQIAAWWRLKFDIPCVAITGSNGKSTTKEMAAAATGAIGEVLKTEGNFNNLIGLPLTVFRLEKEHRVAILEMGMNAPGEIKRLTEISRPTIGLITNVTAAHLEKLHTVETVAKAKGELFEAMDASAKAIVNGEDRWVMEMAKKRGGQKIVFGMQNDFDVRFLHMETTSLDSMDLKMSVFGREYRVVLPVPGSHNVMNALAAVAVSIALGVDAGDAIERLAYFKPMAMRMERVQLANGVRIVNDSYNANPESMKVAFRTVGAARRAGRFISVLGDMLELGDQSRDLHAEVGETAAKMGVERIYVVGDFAGDVARGAKTGGLDGSNIVVCEGTEQTGRILAEDIRAGDVVLVKGSRGMKMERVVEYLKMEIGTG